MRISGVTTLRRRATRKKKEISIATISARDEHIEIIILRKLIFARGCRHSKNPFHTHAAAAMPPMME